DTDLLLWAAGQPDRLSDHSHRPQRSNKPGSRRSASPSVACGEHPELPLRIDGAIKTITPKLVRRLQQHICACRARSSAMRIDVIDVDIHPRVKSAQRSSAGHWAQPGTDLTEHDLPGSMCKLRMCQATLWSGTLKDPLEGEGFLEKSRCTINVLVKEVRRNIRWSQHTAHCAISPCQ